MASKGEPLGKVTVLFPSAGRTTYIPEFHEIHVQTGVPFSDEGAVYHVYGHHTLTTLAESATPDFENGICDQPGNPGHCLFAPENGFASWTEGWPDFFAAMMHDRFNAQDGYGPTPFSF